jgi:hypothetical protein
MLKYPKIKNHYDKKFQNQWLLTVPNLFDIEFVGQSKYDGSNISIEFEKSKSFSIFTRNQKLGGNADFMGIREVLDRFVCKNLLTKIQSWLENHTTIQKVNLFGEFYGPGIQKRINYGKTRKIKFFDVYFDSKLQSAAYFLNWMRDLNALDLIVEFELREMSFIEMIRTAQQLSNSRDIEGFVIKPLNQVLVDNDENPFFVKVKSHKFIDTQPEISIKDDLIDTNILNCINQNRILDCKSQIVWQDFKHFAEYVLNDILDSTGIQQEKFSSDSNKIFLSKINHVSKKLFNFKTGELY